MEHMDIMMTLVTTMTISFLNAPYAIHMISLMKAIINIIIETFFADFSFQVFSTWGKKVSAVTAQAP
jgi:hypothetical protein